MQAYIELAPCALIPPHVHARATETVFAVEGNLTVGFHEEPSTGRVLVNQVNTETTAVVPQGVVHFQQNDNCAPAKFLSTLDNKDPGTAILLEQMLRFPQNVVRGTFAGVSTYTEPTSWR